MSPFDARDARVPRPPLRSRITLLLLAVLAPACPLPAAEPAPVWNVTVIAGDGRAATTGDGGPARQASLNNPFGVVRGPDGALYVCEYDGQVVRRIDAAGIITTFAGSGRRGPGGDGESALLAEFNQPHEIRFDKEGNLFVADMRNHRIRRIDGQTRRVTTVAGTGEAGYSGDGGPAVAAKLNQPHSIQFDQNGQLYICDIGNHRVRRIDPATGRITTFAGTGQRSPAADGSAFGAAALNGPRSLDFDSRGALWLALREGNQVLRLDPVGGTLKVIAGTGEKGFDPGDKPSAAARLSGPKGLAIDPHGDVYLADTESHSIRRIQASTGMLQTVVGTGEKGAELGGNGAPTRLARPHGIFVDTDGSLLVGDSENHRVLRVTRASSK